MIIAFLSVILLFFLFTFLKKVFKLNFCTVCASFFTTWFSLLVLSWFDLYDNLVVVALFMGMSILAIYYIVEESIGIFKFPWLVTTAFIGVSLITSFNWDAFWIILFVWFLFAILYASKSGYLKYLIECCKDL